VLHALGELENEVAAVDLFREIDEILDVGGHALFGIIVIKEKGAPRSKEEHKGDNEDSDGFILLSDFKPLDLK
jgi:hypothetical protein